ncbi:hypothetical protein BHE74_00005595 [Ensete ventricosum]|nr:hypothetical protein BHE74_00005595 [Ensete ventricosum]RZR80056.1 hypothetical protein BHM03_00005966 [Ensete ventricosum]
MFVKFKKVDFPTCISLQVSRRMYVCIIRIDEATNDLIISEREAWDMMNLKEGTLLEGTVCKILPFGAQIRIGATNRRYKQPGLGIFVVFNLLNLDFIFNRVS